MKRWQYYTLDGMNDIYADKKRVLRSLESQVIAYFDSFNYKEIATPGLEFLDVYDQAELVPAENLFKLIDEKGRVLALRYDGTIPCLRMAATKFNEEDFPLRLSYAQNVFRFNELGGGKQRSFMQAGIELLGLEGAKADAEVIAIAIGAVKTLGIADVQVAVGQVAFIQALLSDWDLSAKNYNNLLKLIGEKNSLALSIFAREIHLSIARQNLLQSCFSGPLGLADLKQLLIQDLSDSAKQELIYLIEVLEILGNNNLLDNISIDFALVQSMNYYTGLSFKAYTYGLAYPLFSGGRYDKAAETFGRSIPATGFSLGLELAYLALLRQKKI